MLKVEDLTIQFGGLTAVENFNLFIDKEEVVGLIGPNGAGKTSTLRAISSLNKIKNGDILFEGKSIKNMAAYKLVELGISHVPEGRKIFSDLTVMENLELGAYRRKDKEQVKLDYENIFEKFPILRERKKQLAGTLSGGEQQMLAIGRALMNRPKLILLDEPSMGLAPLIVKNIFKIIEEINKGGTTVLLVEQNANMALSIAHRAYVLETGSIVLEGEGKEIMNNVEIKEAYLGK